MQQSWTFRRKRPIEEDLTTCTYGGNLFDPQQFSDSRPNDKINGPNDDSNSVASFDDVANESLFAYEPFSLPESSSKDLTSAKIRAVKKATFARPPKARVAREDGGLTKHKRFSSQTKQRQTPRSVPESRGGHSIDDLSDDGED
eukprot:scaffold39395_cov63-Cyclotella_meneghiniana.AAC.4